MLEWCEVCTNFITVWIYCVFVRIFWHVWMILLYVVPICTHNIYIYMHYWLDVRISVELHELEVLSVLCWIFLMFLFGGMLRLLTMALSGPLWIISCWKHRLLSRCVDSLVNVGLRQMLREQPSMVGSIRLGMKGHFNFDLNHRHSSHFDDHSSRFTRFHQVVQWGCIRSFSGHSVSE